MDYSYQYDRVGNVVNKWDGSRLDQYSYDAYYRLAGVTSSVYGPRSYGYNELGNIVTKDGRNYSYAHPTKVHAVTSDGQYTYGYDANGNLVSRSDGRAYLYDAENRMISLTAGGITSSYLYDPTGERILKSDGTSSVYYFFPEYEEEVSGASTVAVSYYYANGLKVAQRRSDTGVGYIHQDHLGSSVRMSDGYGTLSFDAVYEPYGETAYQAGSASTRYRFTGQENDGATGLYYYHARYYDPELGRFIQPDPLIVDGLNHYTYCANNPVRYTDPTGLWVIDLWFLKLAGGEDANGGFSLQVGIPGVATASVSVNPTDGLTAGASVLGGLADAQVNIKVDNGVSIDAFAGLGWGTVEADAHVAVSSSEISIGANTSFMGLPVVGLNGGWQNEVGFFVDAYCPLGSAYIDSGWNGSGGSSQFVLGLYAFNSGVFDNDYGDGWLWEQTYGNNAGLYRYDKKPLTGDPADAIAEYHDFMCAPPDSLKSYGRATMDAVRMARGALRKGYSGLSPRERRGLRLLEMLMITGIAALPLGDSNQYDSRKQKWDSTHP